MGASGDLIRRACGGNALYAVAGAHLWDASVGLVARVGRDYPRGCLEVIGEAVDTSGLIHLPEDHPLHVAFAYRADGSRTRRIPPEALAAIPAAERADFIDDTHDDERYFAASPAPDDVPRPWLDGSAGFHIPALMARSQAHLVDALRAAQPSCVITTDAPWYEHRDGRVVRQREVLAGIDAVLPSEEDLTAFRPGVPLLDACREVIAAGARAVVVKLGADGSLVMDADGAATHVPAYPARAVDPTGAGDGFCGGFLVGLHETGDLVQAALYGTVAASFIVEERAAIPVLAVSREAAHDRLAGVASRVRTGIRDDPRVVTA